jgi:hypothetical protein
LGYYSEGSCSKRSAFFQSDLSIGPQGSAVGNPVATSSGSQTSTPHRPPTTMASPHKLSRSSTDAKFDIKKEMPDEGSILQNSISAENFSDKFSSSSLGQTSAQKQEL